MKILCKNMHMALFALCFGLVLTPESQAKVCFVGDEDCAGNMDFGDYKAPDGEALCDGYTSGSCGEGEHVVGYCPYDSSYVKCCGPEFIYDVCAYPRVFKEKCGNMYSCDCDTDKFPYTQTKCEETNAYPAGASCSLGQAGGEGKTALEIYYSTCLCDRGKYIYTKEQCDAYNGNVSVDSSCTDSAGVTYYEQCTCGFEQNIDFCEYGAPQGAESCVSGGITYVEQCCSCSNYPVTLNNGKPVSGGPNLDKVYYEQEAGKAIDSNGNEVDVVNIINGGWEVCGCSKGKDRVRITKCRPGWKPTTDQTGCERITCNEALSLYLSKYPKTAVGIYNGSKIIGYEAADDPSNPNAVGSVTTLSKATTGILAGDVTVSSLGNMTKLISVSDFLKNEPNRKEDPSNPNDMSWMVNKEMVQASCSAEGTKTLTLGSIERSTELSISNVNLRLSNGSKIKVPLSLSEVSVTGGSTTFNKKLSIYSSTGKNFGQSDGAYTFRGFFEADGYNFTFDKLNFEAASSVTELASITLPSGGKMLGTMGIYVYPSTSSYTGKYITITGPKTSNSSAIASIYTSAYVGRDPASNHAGKMWINLEGGVHWKLYGEKDDSIILLTTGSYIEAKSLSGYKAEIKRNANSTWSKCSMANSYVQPYDRRKAAACKQPKIGCGGDSWSSKRTKYFVCNETQEVKPRNCAGGKVNSAPPARSNLYHPEVACSINNSSKIKTEKSFKLYWLPLTYEAVNCAETKVRGSVLEMTDDCYVKGVGNDNKSDSAVCGDPLLSCS